MLPHAMLTSTTQQLYSRGVIQTCPVMFLVCADNTVLMSKASTLQHAQHSVPEHELG